MESRHQELLLIHRKYRDGRWRASRVGCSPGDRLFGHIIDYAAGGGDAAFKSGDAFHEFDALLVFERNILLAGDGHAVDLQAGGQIDGESADLVVTVVADRRVVFADGCVVLHDV